MGFAETVLQYAEAAIGLCQTFDRDDVMAVGLHGKHQAGAYRFAVEHD